MKTQFKTFIQLLIAGIFAIFTTSCNKKNDVTPATATGTLEFHLHTDVDSNEVDSIGLVYNLVYNSYAGRGITVSQAHLLISNIQLIGTNGAVAYNVPGRIIHKVQPIEPYVVGNVPVGNYNAVSYTVGLDAATNATVPVPTDTALYDPTLWFATGAASVAGFASYAPTVPSTGGYIYLDFEGTIDTSAAKTGKYAPFHFRIGGGTNNINAVKVTLPNQGFTVSANQTTFVHMVINYAALLNNLPLNNLQIIETSADNSTYASYISSITSNISTGGSGALQHFISYEAGQ
jgi:hypothetical protein